jgi:hypothetical protein
MTKVGLRALDKCLSDEGLNLDQFGSILSLFYFITSCCRTAVGVGQRALSLSAHMAGGPPHSWPRGG